MLFEQKRTDWYHVSFLYCPTHHLIYYSVALSEGEHNLIFLFRDLSLQLMDKLHVILITSRNRRQPGFKHLNERGNLQNSCISTINTDFQLRKATRPNLECSSTRDYTVNVCRGG